MELNDQLKELVSEISPTDSQQSALRDAHIRLRERLMADDDLKPWIVETFLQGSYRRHTSIRPQGDDKPDVDVVVVTRVDRHKFTPEQAMNLLVPFLNRHYAGKWKKKGRSIGIEMARVKAGCGAHLSALRNGGEDPAGGTRARTRLRLFLEGKPGMEE